MGEDEAFAAVAHGRVLVDTVSPTRNAARINWLFVYAGEQVTQAWSDAKVLTVFERYERRGGLLIEPVSISHSPDPRDSLIREMGDLVRRSFSEGYKTGIKDWKASWGDVTEGAPSNPIWERSEGFAALASYRKTMGGG